MDEFRRAVFLISSLAYVRADASIVPASSVSSPPLITSAESRFISIIEASLHGVPSLLTCRQSILGGSGLIAIGTKEGGVAEWFKAHAWKACWG
jgi:hypothetical protein